MSPDEIVVLDDSRGMHSLLRLLGPGSPSARAAQLLLEDHELLSICTGFPVAGASETDGPASAVVLARALIRLGRMIQLVSWAEALASWAPVLADIPRIALPVAARPARLRGSAITIEVCGRLADGRYENMHGRDVSALTPWFEDAIAGHALISIGDGGNEFGMGSAPASWFEARAVRQPVSTCDALVVGQVSNWAVLAVVAQLARATGMLDLLPEPQAYQALLDALAARGVVDGVSGFPEATEDGRPHGAGPRMLLRLREWAALPSAR